MQQYYIPIMNVDIMWNKVDPGVKVFKFVHNPNDYGDNIKFMTLTYQQWAINVASISPEVNSHVANAPISNRKKIFGG